MMSEIAKPIHDEILKRLKDIKQDANIRYLLAVESGSRAWGFSSPDSDYDVRFIYIRSCEDYLSLSPPRDVIEQPIVDEIDLNGWDVRKALGLMLKHNAVASEWIESPIRYLDDDPAVVQIADLIDRHFNPYGYAKHYAALGKRQAARWLDGGEQLTVKKYFYALRPALAVRALRLDPSRRPPMRLQDLVSRCDLSVSIADEIDELVRLKAKTREAGAAKPRQELSKLIVDELDRADEVTERPIAGNFSREADALFVNLVSGSQ